MLGSFLLYISRCFFCLFNSYSCVSKVKEQKLIFLSVANPVEDVPDAVCVCTEAHTQNSAWLIVKVPLDSNFVPVEEAQRSPHPLEGHWWDSAPHLVRISWRNPGFLVLKVVSRSGGGDPQLHKAPPVFVSWLGLWPPPPCCTLPGAIRVRKSDPGRTLW